MIHRKVVQSFILVAALMLVGGAARAELIPLSLPPAPDIFNSFISVNYDATSHLFTASGYAFQYTAADNTIYTFDQGDGLFNINVYIGNDGTLLGPGSLSVGGTLVLPSGTVGNANDGSLLTGNITRFGFSPTNDGVLEFVFNSTGGDLAYLFGEGGVSLSQIGAPDSGFGFSGSFSQNFGTDPSGFGPAVADIGATPEPGTLLLFVSGAGLMLLKRRRSHSA